DEPVLLVIKVPQMRRPDGAFHGELKAQNPVSFLRSRCGCPTDRRVLSLGETVQQTDRHDRQKDDQREKMVALHRYVSFSRVTAAVSGRRSDGGERNLPISGR